VSVQALRPIPAVPPGRRQPLVGSRVVGVAIFVFTEAMLFAGLVSAFTIVRAGAPVWPPAGQPRLPLEATALNTLALLASGLLLFRAQRRFAHDPDRARRPLLGAVLLGAAFVSLQGFEWIALIRQGLTVTSSTLGSFFYLVVGLHALHALAALGALLWAWLRVQRGRASSDLFAAAALFWYFVVGVWPLIYWRVYL
jgi:heme/copper-type cytochrome/quinol oxidase subunit 3